MNKIRELLVVEGKHDKDKLEKLFDCDIVCTNGLGVDEETMKLIRTCAEHQGVIVLTDPDGPGERIRRQIMEEVPQARHVFILQKKAIGKRNVGIEYVDDETLKEYLNRVVTFEKGEQSLEWAEYLHSGMMGSRKLRERVCEKLNIGFSNNKTLFKRLNMLKISGEKLREIIEDE